MREQNVHLRNTVGLDLRQQKNASDQMTITAVGRQQAATAACPVGTATHATATGVSMVVNEAVHVVRRRETEHKAASIARGHALPRWLRVVPWTLARRSPRAIAA